MADKKQEVKKEHHKTKKKKPPANTPFYVPKELTRFQKFKIYLSAFLLDTVILCLYRTYNIVMEEGAEEFYKMQQEKKQVVFSFWHHSILFFSGFLYREYHLKATRLSILISQSKDGEFIARTVERWGGVPVRGSSTRGGSGALKKLVRLLRDNPYSVVTTPDGPKGPPLQFQDGTVFLARVAKLPIVTMSMYAENPIVFNSWDNFQVPKPFSTVRVRLGKPFYIDQNSDMASDVLFLEKEMNRMCAPPNKARS